MLTILMDVSLCLVQSDSEDIDARHSKRAKLHVQPTSGTTAATTLSLEAEASDTAVKIEEGTVVSMEDIDTGEATLAGYVRQFGDFFCYWSGRGRSMKQHTVSVGVLNSLVASLANTGDRTRGRLHVTNYVGPYYIELRLEKVPPYQPNMPPARQYAANATGILHYDDLLLGHVQTEMLARPNMTSSETQAIARRCDKLKDRHLWQRQFARPPAPRRAGGPGSVYLTPPAASYNHEDSATYIREAQNGENIQLAICRYNLLRLANSVYASTPDAPITLVDSVKLGLVPLLSSYLTPMVLWFSPATRDTLLASWGQFLRAEGYSELYTLIHPGCAPRTFHAQERDRQRLRLGEMIELDLTLLRTEAVVEVAQREAQGIASSANVPMVITIHGQPRQEMMVEEADAAASVSTARQSPQWTFNARVTIFPGERLITLYTQCRALLSEQLASTVTDMRLDFLSSSLEHLVGAATLPTMSSAGAAILRGLIGTGEVYALQIKTRGSDTWS